MDHDETERCEHENGNVGRVLVHPSLFRSVPAHAGEEPGDESLWMSPAGEALRRGHRQDAVVWYLGDEELFNGCITEIRLAAPAMWLQTRIEGLPEAPDACFHLADGSIVRVPLGEGATVRWRAGAWIARCAPKYSTFPPGLSRPSQLTWIMCRSSARCSRCRISIPCGLRAKRSRRSQNRSDRSHRSQRRACGSRETGTDARAPGFLPAPAQSRTA